MRRQVRQSRPSPKRELDESEGGTSANKRSKIVIDNSQDIAVVVVDVIKAKSSDIVPDNGSPFICPEVPAPNHSQNEATIEVALNNKVPESSNVHAEQMSSKTNGTVEDTVNIPNISQNGNCDPVPFENMSTDSGISSELQCNDSQSNVANKEVLSAEENKAMPVLSAENLEIHNSESTDSFQSEGFDALRCTSQAESKDPLPSSSREQEEINEHQNRERSEIAKIIDIDSLTLSHLEVTQLEGHSDVIYSVAAEGDLALSSSGDTTVRVWNLLDKTMVCNFSGHSDSVRCVHLLSQNQSDLLRTKLNLPEVSRIAITGSLDCNIKLWSVYEGQELASIYTFNGITSLGFLESESLVIIGTEGGKLELWDVCNSKVVQSVKAHEEAVSDLKVHDFNIYTVSTDGSVKVWLFEDEEIYPVYTRKRKEKTQDNELSPSQWKSVAALNNIMYLGDDTKHIKVLDSVAGRLRLFKNQVEKDGACECVLADEDLLLSSYYEPASETGGINVWKIPEMTYICTLAGEVQDVCSLAVVRKEGFLRIISGGHQLLVWDFDFSKPPKKESEDPFTAVELETVGREIAESSLQSKKKESLNKSTDSSASNAKNRWCTIM